MNTGAEPGKLILSWEFWEFWERLLPVGFAGNLPLGILGNSGNSFKFRALMKTRLRNVPRDGLIRWL